MSVFRPGTPISLGVDGATLADLRQAVADAPPGLSAHLDEDRDPVRLRVSRGFGSPHGGARGVADLRVSEVLGTGLRITGEVRPGRLNRFLMIPFTGVAVLFVGLGLLLMLVNLEAVGLVVVGGIFGGVVWTVRSVERPYVESVAADVSGPDGWLLQALATASRERPAR
ncbi:hypothetical protein [Nocardioides sp. W7]|uniref:hypothetical protein n=1 Tax=Nocardioides sp. W7 TaxID=2931390 RepID=UPI001FD5CC18|nr:hypothetical protein [Nocardioides sp. W7]